MELRGAHEVGGVPRGGALHPRGPLVAPLTYLFHPYIPTYPKLSGSTIDREFRRCKPL